MKEGTKPSSEKIPTKRPTKSNKLGKTLQKPTKLRNPTNKGTGTPVVKLNAITQYFKIENNLKICPASVHLTNSKSRGEVSFTFGAKTSQLNKGNSRTMENPPHMSSPTDLREGNKPSQPVKYKPSTTTDTKNSSEEGGQRLLGAIEPQKLVSYKRKPDSRSLTNL